MLSIVLGFLFGFCVIKFLNAMFGARIGKGRPAFWFCCLSSFVFFLTLELL